MAESLRIGIRRRLFSGVCVLSLILCLATVGLLVRSYWRVTTLPGAGGFEVRAHRGDFVFDNHDAAGADLDASLRYLEYHFDPAKRASAQSPPPRVRPREFRSGTIPCGVVAVVTALMPALGGHKGVTSHYVRVK